MSKPERAAGLDGDASEDRAVGLDWQSSKAVVALPKQGSALAKTEPYYATRLSAAVVFKDLARPQAGPSDPFRSLQVAGTVASATGQIVQAPHMSS